MAIYDYHMQKVFANSVVVDDGGNCCLECENPEGDTWYIRLKSIMGFVYALKFGPVCPDLTEIDWDYAMEYRKFKYSDKSVDKEITGFINDPKKGITEVHVVDEQTLLDAIPDKIAFIKE